MSTPLCIIARTGRPVTADEVGSLLAHLRQQGPDGEGIWSDGSVALAHLALFETPEMRFESQPASLDPRIDPSPPQDVVISADLRLDNRAQLATLLHISAELLPTLGDSQLVLAAYLRWGEACPRYLLGDFAFIIWDGPQRKLFCARDPLGVKPLFVYIRPHLFLAAGDIRGLVAHPQGPRQPNLQALAYYMREMQFNHPTMTYLEGVEGLAPAHTLTVTAGQTRLQRYWFPDQFRERPLPSTESIESAAEELRSLLEDAVCVRLRRQEGYAIGSHLSGGLDSTAVAFMAARQLRTENESISTYSWQPQTDDAEALASSEYATLTSALQQEGFDHTTSVLTLADVERDLARDICLHHSQRFSDEPLVRRAAAFRHVRIMLSGWGGDELISSHGRSSLSESFWRGRWREALGDFRALRKPAGKNPLRHSAATLYQHVIAPVLPDFLFDRLSPQAQREEVAKGSEWFSPSPELAAQLAHLPPLVRVRRTTSMAAYRLALLNLGHLHRRMESWAAGGADDHMVYRYPLLDRRVVELALQLPRAAFVQGKTRRYLFRRAMSNLLPHDVCWGAAKFEPVRVNLLLELTKAAFLPVFTATVAELTAPPRLEIEPLRRHLIALSDNPAIDVSTLSTTERAIQLLGAGRHLPV